MTKFAEKSFGVYMGQSKIHSCVKNSVPVEEIDRHLVEITKHSLMKCKVCGTIWYYDENNNWKEA